jgi:hypothetical protein
MLRKLPQSRRPIQKRPMGEYRAYAVGLDGHFIGFEPLTSRDDAEAGEKAKRLVEGNDIELWSGERLVIRISHRPD